MSAFPSPGTLRQIEAGHYKNLLEFCLPFHEILPKITDYHNLTSISKISEIIMQQNRNGWGMMSVGP